MGEGSRSGPQLSTLKQPPRTSRGKTLSFLPELLPCGGRHLLPRTSFSFPAKIPGCPSAGLTGGKGGEEGNGRPKGYGGGVEAGRREGAKFVFLEPLPTLPVGLDLPACGGVGKESIG